MTATVANRRRLSWIALAALVATLGCYSPKISDGGFSCPGGGPCPDGFHCAANHLCYREADASYDMQIDKPMVCTSATSLPQTCTAAALGGACNPVCQSECNGCGWCAVSTGGASTCLTGSGGTKNVGDICSPASETDCKPGLYCQPECGGTTGRCYSFCSTNADCSVTGSKCNVTARKMSGGATVFSLCSLVSTCNPVGQMAQTTCPTGFACYPVPSVSTGVECDCPGTFPPDQPCSLTAQCAPGSSCFGFGATGGDASRSSTCLQTCLDPGDCTSPATCNNPGTTYGYCL